VSSEDGSRRSTALSTARLRSRFRGCPEPRDRASSPPAFGARRPRRARTRCDDSKRRAEGPALQSRDVALTLTWPGHFGAWPRPEDHAHLSHPLMTGRAGPRGGGGDGRRAVLYVDVRDQRKFLHQEHIEFFMRTIDVAVQAVGLQARLMSQALRKSARNRELLRSVRHRFSNSRSAFLARQIHLQLALGGAFDLRLLTARSSRDAAPRIRTCPPRPCPSSRARRTGRTIRRRRRAG